MSQPLTHDSASAAPPRNRKIELPWLILAALLLSTLLAAFQSSRQLQAANEVRFDEIAQTEKRALIRQLRDVERLLGGARAFEAALPNPTPSAWDTYIRASVQNAVGDAQAILAVQLELPKTAAPLTTMLTRTPGIEKVIDRQESPTLLAAIDRAKSTNTLTLSRQLITPAEASASPHYVAIVAPHVNAASTTKPTGATAQSSGVVPNIPIMRMTRGMSLRSVFSSWGVDEIFNLSMRLPNSSGISVLISALESLLESASGVETRRLSPSNSSRTTG